MKKILLSLFIFIAMLVTGLSANAQQTSSAQPQRLLKHVVLFKFKDASTASDITKIEKAFAGLSRTITQIKGFEWGKNNSPENLNQGLTHCFLVSFASEKDRDDYLVHPRHKEFVQLAGPHFDKVTVVDYWMEPAI